MKDKHASMTNQSLTKQTRLLGNARFLIKEETFFISEDKSNGGAIKDRRSNRIKVSIRWIHYKVRIEILNSYYYVYNGTWLCDKSRILQSSQICLYKFMQS